MELRCEQTNKKAPPILDSSKNDLRPRDESSTMMMDVDQRPPPLHDGDHHQHLRQHPSPASAPAHAPAPASTASSSAHQSPIPPPAHHQKPSLPPITGRPSPPASSRSREYSLPAQTPTTNGHHRSNGIATAYPSPSPQEVSMDALARLQTQVQYNTAGLQTQRRDFETLSHAVSRLTDEMGRIESMVVALRRELQSRPIAPPAPAHSSPQGLDDATLEAFANSLSGVASKVNEVDALRMQLEIVKRRIKIMEETAAQPPSSAAPPAGPYASPREPPQQVHPPLPMQHAPLPAHAPPHQAPPFHASPPVPRLGTPGHAEMRPDLRPAPLPSAQAPYHPSADMTGSQPNQPNSGWVSVNPSGKRQHPNGVDSPGDGRSESMGSPKRPKLAPLEPRVGPETVATPMRYDPVEREVREYHAEPSREPQFAASAPTTFVPYTSTSEQHPEESWHSESQRAPASAGKESRRGRGGGRGRGRRSLPADSREHGTPEWEKPGYGSQVGPDGYYHMEVTPNGTKVPRGSSLARRGSGGSGPIAMRPIEMTRPPNGTDPYAHTKKTRTKPVRNADGILIRKDGRPDMRSQSSAANLRKVHARKEQERILEQRANTPTSGLASTPVNGDSNGGSNDNSAGSTPEKEGAPANTQDRHEAIMKQMFPHGVNDQVNRRNFHDQFFPPGSSPTAKVKPEVNTPSERESVSEVDESAERGPQTLNGRSPTTEAADPDKMDVSQGPASAEPVPQAA